MALERLKRAVARVRAGQRSVWTKGRAANQSALTLKAGGLRPSDRATLNGAEGEETPFIYGVTPMDDSHIVL